MARIVSAGNGSQFHSGEWAYATNRKLGLKFSIQGETHHGWARLSVYVVKGRPYVRSTLTGYAYETIAGRGFTGAELALDARPWNYATKCSGWRWSGPPMAVGALRRSCAVAACRSIANECSGGCGKTTCCACVAGILHPLIGMMHQSGRGRRRANAISRAATANRASSVASRAQPIARRENASSTTAKYTNSSRSRM